MTGYNDGKNEARHVPSFEQYYFDYKGNYEKALRPDKFLILGKKGTGKSILAEYIKRNSEKDSCWFCDINSYKDFRFHELKYLKSEAISPNEYSTIWEWIILVQLAEIIVNDQAISAQKRGILENFLKNNFVGMRLNSNRIVKITKKNEIKGNILKNLLSLSGAKDTTYESGSYLDYLEDLNTCVVEALKESSSRYTLIYDELDDQFRDEEVYKSNLISLIKTVNNLNSQFLDCNIDAKVILLLRSDIFYVLNDPDLNKIEQDNSLKIEWGTSTDFNSPLIEMILLKIRKSCRGFSNYSNAKLYKILFPKTISNQNSVAYILGRTYLRPRDIVAYLNCIKDDYPNATSFKEKFFLIEEKKYSEYLYKEIKNELCGHFSEDKINQTLLLLKQYKKTKFKYRQIKSYYEEKKNMYPAIDLDESLTFLFDVGVIGNYWFNPASRKNYYTFIHRENAVVNFDRDFVIHPGLRKEFTLC